MPLTTDETKPTPCETLVHGDSILVPVRASGATVSPTTPTETVMLPSDHERQQIFFMLQKLSSFNAWQRICGFYEAWSAAAENSLREAEMQGWSSKTSVPKSTCSRIAMGLTAMQKSLAKAQKGDQRVFKNFNHAEDFSIARKILFNEASSLDRIEMGENGIDGKHTPFWREYTDAMKATCQAWFECADHILDNDFQREAVLTVYDETLRNALAIMPFPTVLARIPEPIGETFMRTGKWVKFAGIWEPIVVVKAKNTSLLSWFKRVPAPAPPFRIAGAMNYLHAYAPAPAITVETAEGPMDCDATWRLLWRDDRYLDGIVPEQEAHYRFMKPPKPPVHRPLVSESGQTSWAQSGTATWTGGTWMLESDLNTSVRLQKGDKLPLYRGRTVHWLLAEE